MNWNAIAIMYVFTLAFIGFILWMRTKLAETEWKQEIGKLREEVSGLAMSIGLRKRGPPTQVPPTMGG